MNYLAHALLSGDNEDLLLGNFLADGIRGNKMTHFSPEVQKGIRLHRHIDSFTDAHPLNVEARQLLQPIAGKFAGVALDIFYDHLLCNNWKLYTNTPLPDFINRCYEVITRNQAILPERTAYLYPYMVRDNWLPNYSKKEGIMRSLTGLSHRIPSQPNLPAAGQFAFEEIEAFNKIFTEFFPLLIKYCSQIVDNQ